MLPMQTAPHGFDNFCTPSLQDISYDAVRQSTASWELWQQHHLPALLKTVEEKREPTDQALSPKPAAHTSLRAHRVPPASQQLLPSLHAVPSLSSAGAQPTLLQGEASDLSLRTSSIPTAFLCPIESLVTHEPQGPNCPLPPSLLILFPILQAPCPRCLCPEGTNPLQGTKSLHQHCQRMFHHSATSGAAAGV